jgi:hypothetical protein
LTILRNNQCLPAKVFTTENEMINGEIATPDEFNMWKSGFRKVVNNAKD